MISTEPKRRIFSVRVDVHNAHISVEATRERVILKLGRAVGYLSETTLGINCSN